MSASRLLFLYVLLLFAALAALACYYELRRRRFGPTPTQDRIFRCERCSCVYTDDPDVTRSRCPKCGAMNDPFAF